MPRLLDLFCGAGGAAMGYHQAGFDEIVGVDIKPQSRYPFRFVLGDALEYVAAHGREFDVIHASPPCQRYSAMTACRPGLKEHYPDLVAATRSACAGMAYVIENVPRAPLHHPIVLCGASLGLTLYRHRLFESSERLQSPEHMPHAVRGARAGHWSPGKIISVSGNCAPIALARHAMGINWMTREELAESIPPAYTKFIGAQLLHALQ